MIRGVVIGRALRLTGLVCLASLALSGCLLSVMRLPPVPEDETPAIIQGATPGQGGVLMWHSRLGGIGDVEDRVLSKLRASGVFTEVRGRPTGDHHYYEYSPARHGHVDWILSLDGASTEDGDASPEIPFDTLLTFGLIPDVNSTKVSFEYRLTRVTARTREPHSFLIPSHGGWVRGLVAALVLSVHPSWHLFREEEKRDDRLADRLAMEVLRTVVDAPHH